jgi:excisionase family DNA binding protein
MSIKFLTTEEVAKILRISPGTVNNRIYRKEDMPDSIRFGRRRLFPIDKFDAWMVSHYEGDKTLDVDSNSREGIE